MDVSYKNDEYKQFLAWKAEVAEKARDIVKTKIKEKISTVHEIEKDIIKSIDENTSVVVRFGENISSNEFIVSKLKFLKEASLDLYHLVSDLKLHLTMKLAPSIERTSFENQLDMIYLRHMKILIASCKIFLEELKRYFESRAIHVKKVVKNREIEDFELSVESYDDVHILSLGRWFTSLKQEYLVIETLFMNNGFEDVILSR